LSLLFCLALTGPALAQDNAEPQDPAIQAPDPSDYDEISELLDSIQTRVDEMNANAKDTDAAMAFLSDQVEAAIRKLLSRETENSTLRDAALGLSDELKSVAATRDELDFKVVRLTQEKDEIFERLEGQVRELASLLSLEREVSASLRKSLGDRSAELRDERAALESRLTAETATLETTQALLDDTRVRNAALDGELVAANARMVELNRQLAALRQQIAELSGLLENSEGENRAQQDVIADLGRRLNLALATKVRELARYRSEFFGRLREVLGERSDVRIVGDRFVFQSEVLFRTGEAELEEPGRAQLHTLANSLIEIGRTIPTGIDWVLRIDGHTDERPIQTSRFPSNWELSTARAISVVKFLIEQGVPAERVMAAGFAHFRPLGPGRDDTAFRRNRRIEFRLTQK
jgi:chemotaxis protein MotB